MGEDSFFGFYQSRQEAVWLSICTHSHDCLHGCTGLPGAHCNISAFKGAHTFLKPLFCSETRFSKVWQLARRPDRTPKPPPEHTPSTHDVKASTLMFRQGELAKLEKWHTKQSCFICTLISPISQQETINVDIWFGHTYHSEFGHIRYKYLLSHIVKIGFIAKNNTFVPHRKKYLSSLRGLPKWRKICTDSCFKNKVFMVSLNHPQAVQSNKRATCRAWK